MANQEPIAGYVTKDAPAAFICADCVKRLGSPGMHLWLDRYFEPVYAYQVGTGRYQCGCEVAACGVCDQLLRECVK